MSPKQHLHGSLLELALKQSLNCVPSPTAFSVGAVIFLPRSSAQQGELSSESDLNESSTILDKLYDLLEPVFPSFRIGAISDEQSTEDDTNLNEEVQGLILSASHSRAIEGNTHAEANALTIFNEKISQVPIQLQQAILDATNAQPNGAGVSLGAVYQALLSHAWMYATMEPCSRRTSGLRSCTEAILDSSLKRVYIGVQEPPDYVQCEGIQLLKEGGVKVIHIPGYEEECLKAARRGLE